MNSFSISPREMVASFWRNRSLVKALTTRDVIGRYQGSVFGILWSFFHPVFMLAVYTFVFSVVFKARWHASSDSKTEFALILFIGLIVFNMFAECLNRSPVVIVSNVNYVKKVVFPLEILPLVPLGSALFHSAISFGVWLVFYWIFVGLPPASGLWLPLVILPFWLFIMGLCWCIASLGVYLRDISQVVGLLTPTLMFLSPVFYPASALPDEVQILFRANPLTTTIEQTRDILIFGRQPDFSLLATFLVLASLFAWAGFAWFQKTRRGFADVL